MKILYIHGLNSSPNAYRMDLLQKRGHIVVVLGACDEEVDPWESWHFFSQTDNQAPQQRVILCQWLAHQIDDDTYRDMINWAGL